jgi:hypothetical protein
VSSSITKVMIAFLAGLVMALGGALIYVRAHEKPIPVKTAQVIESPQQPEQAAAPEPAQAEPAPPEPAPPEPAVKPEPPIEKSVKKAPRPKVQKRQPAEPVQVVENKPVGHAAGSTVETASNYPGVSQSPGVRQSPGVSQSPAAPANGPAPDPPAQVQAPPPPPPQPHSVELPAGTTLTIRLGEKLSTEDNYTGDTFRGTLDQQLILDGFIIADKGSKVLGRISEADKAGRVRGIARLSLVLTEINTTDGQRIAVETNTVEKQGQTSKGSDTAKVAGGAALGALIGALGGGGKGAAIGAGAGGAAGTGVVLATRGKAAVLPSESRLTFALANPVKITEKLNR